jgi:hypothetical protein
MAIREIIILPENSCGWSQNPLKSHGGGSQARRRLRDHTTRPGSGLRRSSRPAAAADHVDLAKGTRTARASRAASSSIRKYCRRRRNCRLRKAACRSRNITRSGRPARCGALHRSRRQGARGRRRGLVATCIQHEIDHLNGVLFVDYLSKLKRDRVLKGLPQPPSARWSRKGMAVAPRSSAPPCGGEVEGGPGQSLVNYVPRGATSYAPLKLIFM